MKSYFTLLVSAFLLFAGLTNTNRLIIAFASAIALILFGIYIKEIFNQKNP